MSHKMYTSQGVYDHDLTQSLQETDVQLVWMVRHDERIIRHNQDGVQSHSFQPGPLAETQSKDGPHHVKRPRYF